MIKVLFLIHNLGPGGAEKVLVNLVNNMDPGQFDITLLSLFDHGVNRQFIAKHVHYKYVFKHMVRGSVTAMKFFSPRLLHSLIVREQYDIEVSYLEGQCARIISGCDKQSVKRCAWIHIQQPQNKNPECFRTFQEAIDCYNRFDRIVCVSHAVKETFDRRFGVNVPVRVLYNTLETDRILRMSEEDCDKVQKSTNTVNLIAVGKLIHNKGFDRLIPMVEKINQEGLQVKLNILGTGEDEEALRKYVSDHHMQHQVTFLGYQTNPYKYIRNSDLFVCASLQEGFSTAASEALFLGVPVLTVDVGGMREMLGENNEYGIVVPNDDEALYSALRDIIKDPEKIAYYRNQAGKRGKFFSTKATVDAVQEMFIELL